MLSGKLFFFESVFAQVKYFGSEQAQLDPL